MVARRHSEHRKSSLLGVVGIAAILLSGCGNGNGLAALRSGSAQPASQNPEYMIGGNDELSIRYVYNPSFDQTVAVQPDGRIALPMIGQVTAAGRTPKELSRELWELYDRYCSGQTSSSRSRMPGRSGFSSAVKSAGQELSRLSPA